MSDLKNKKDKDDIIYCLSNPMMPEVVKIGTTSDLKKRMNDLYTTGVPVAFKLEYAIRCENCAEKEKNLHDIFQDYRRNPHREFFSVDVERVITTMKLITDEEITLEEPSTKEEKEDQKILEKITEKQNKRAENVTFKYLGIPVGAELVFTRDDEITAKVMDKKNQIEYKGKTGSVSAIATKILIVLNGKSTKVAGPRYWKYNGKTMQEIRDRKEEKTEE